MKSPKKCTRWISVCVDMLDHPVVGVRKGEPFSRAEAWIWLIANAAVDVKQTKHKKEIILLERGQLLGGRDYLAKTWRWSEKKVRCFLNALAASGAISLGQERGQGQGPPSGATVRGQGKGQLANLVTICNYDVYQHKKIAKGQGRGQQKGQQTGQGQGPQPYKKTRIYNPPTPQRGEATIEPASASKGEINPHRDRDPNRFNPDADPQVVGIGWSAEGKLEVFNGTKVEMLKLSGSEEQLQLDLLAVQASGRIGPAMNLHVLKSKVLGLVADRVDQRIQSDRRYQAACADRRAEKPGGKPVRPKLKIDDLPPTTDPAEVKRRFELFLEEKPQYRQRARALWPVFQSTMAQKARDAGLVA